MFQRLSSIDATNTKVAKSEKSLIGGEKIRILSLSLMPDDTLCPARWLAECAEDCLRSSGRGIMQNVIDGRQARTNLWHSDRDAFLSTLKKELHNFIRLCSKQNVVPVTRLNVLSDISWENYLDFEDEFRALFSYDYTKLPARLGKTPSNYRLMFSYSKAPGFENQVKRALEHRVPITAVFRGGFPSEFLGRPVFDGDVSDLANLEQVDSVIGLRVKGHQAKRSESPFIIDNPELIAAV